MKIRNVAHTYAKAFLNVFGASLTQEMIHNISQAAQFLYEHRRALFLLKVPIIPESVKKRGVKELTDRFDLPASIEQLFDLLLKRKRASLFAAVCQEIVREYNKRHHHETVVVASSCPLTEQQKKKIMRFANAQFPGTKKYIFKIDTTLIAGIKIMSDTLMWESSIDNYLRECTQAQIG